MGFFSRLFKPNIEKMKRRRDIDGLIKLLEHHDQDIAVKAVFTFGEIKDRRAVEPLIRILKNDNKHFKVHEQAAMALGEIGDKRATLPLIEILAEFYSKDYHYAEVSDETVNICLKAVQALGKLKEKHTVEPLVKYLKKLYSPPCWVDYRSDTLRVDIEVIKALGEIDATDVLHRIIEGKIQLLPLSHRLFHSDSILGFYETEDICPICAAYKTLIDSGDEKIIKKTISDFPEIMDIHFPSYGRDKWLLLALQQMRDVPSTELTMKLLDIIATVDGTPLIEGTSIPLDNEISLAVMNCLDHPSLYPTLMRFLSGHEARLKSLREERGEENYIERVGARVIIERLKRVLPKESTEKLRNTREKVKKLS